ncbi:hypothetical protein LTR37_001791 [Vermiconidia calcicola]|uniref:Uncharacterized protein n=1 Tax=Vermiconidia calcicola TaxID=1690605 RepID=A0ACC3NUS3_9PEZI|nr:hypothetical protein LTR37_001791 [Vermiconidia calcicola]
MANTSEQPSVVTLPHTLQTEGPSFQMLAHPPVPSGEHNKMASLEAASKPWSPDKKSFPSDSVNSPATVVSNSTNSSSSPLEAFPEKLVSEQIEGKPFDDNTNLKATHGPCGSYAHQWRRSMFRIGSLAGLAALAFAFLQIFASYAILAASDGQTVESWSYQPNVFLAILTAISNKALAFAAVQGTVVTFWLRALKGTSLAQLHRDWAFGLHVYKAILAGRSFSLLALACICVTLVAIDGPLLQRASTVRPEVSGEPIVLRVSIAPQVQSYSTGMAMFGMVGPVTNPGIDYQDQFLPVVRNYSARIPMRGGITGCPGSWTAAILAPALAVDSCTTRLEERNYTTPLSALEKKIRKASNVASEDRRVFWTSFRSLNESAERLQLGTEVSDDAVTQTCVGNLNRPVCDLTSAIAEYQVNINDGVITFVEPPSYPKIVAKANNTSLTDEDVAKYGLETSSGFINTTLSAIFTAAFLDYTWFGLVIFDDVPFLVPMPNRFRFDHITNYEDWAKSLPGACAPAWSDPRDGIMASLNELMVRTGFGAAQFSNESRLKSLMNDGLEVHTNVSGIPLSPVNVSETNYRWLAAAAAVQLFTILMVLFTFWGWWRIGRDTSFSPLEIAKAFDAPLLQGVESNLSGRDISRLEGRRQVQYGILENKTKEKLIIAEADRVRRPCGKPMALSEYYDLLLTRLPRPVRRKIARAEATTNSERPLRHSSLYGELV